MRRPYPDHAARGHTFLRVLPAAAGDDEVVEARRDAERLARDNLPGAHAVEVVRSDDVAAAMAETAARHDLLILGLRVEHAAFRTGRSRAVFSPLTLAIARSAPCATILLSGRRSAF